MAITIELHYNAEAAAWGAPAWFAHIAGNEDKCVTAGSPAEALWDVGELLEDAHWIADLLTAEAKK